MRYHGIIRFYMHQMTYNFNNKTRMTFEFVFNIIKYLQYDYFDIFHDSYSKLLKKCYILNTFRDDENCSRVIKPVFYSFLCLQQFVLLHQNNFIFPFLKVLYLSYFKIFT